MSEDNIRTIVTELDGPEEKLMYSAYQSNLTQYLQEIKSPEFARKYNLTPDELLANLEIIKCIIDVGSNIEIDLILLVSYNALIQSLETGKFVDTHFTRYALDGGVDGMIRLLARVLNVETWYKVLLHISKEENQFGESAEVKSDEEYKFGIAELTSKIKSSLNDNSVFLKIQKVNKNFGIQELPEAPEPPILLTSQ